MSPCHNRTEEFFRLRAQLGNAPPESNKLAAKPTNGDTFYKEVAAIQSMLADARQAATQIGTIRFEAMQAVTREQEDAVSKRLNEVLTSTNAKLAVVKTKIDAVKENPECKNNSVQERMHAALIRKFADVVKDFHGQEELYKKEVDVKTKRQLQVAFPLAPESEIDKMVVDGMDTAQVVRQKMGGTHVAVLEALENVQNKYKDVRRLEQSMRELNQMFLDMAKLVEYQGEMVDSIAHSVQGATKNVEKGEKELKSAYKFMQKKRKLACCTTVFLMILVLVLILVLK